jgi:TonB-linked SusC/RagA family outer membrane protein
MFFCFCNVTNAQKKGVAIKSIIVDIEGKPISGVHIFGPNGDKTTTGLNGSFEINVPDNGSVVLEKKGYISKLITTSDLLSNITLTKSPFLASKEDEINMGVTVKNRRDLVGATSIINTQDRIVYDNTQRVRNYINGLMLGVKGSQNVRGIGNAVFVIDGVIGRDPNILNMEEVDQITVLKDANSVALYGSQGRNGVIVINTKRGKINRKEVKANVRTGFSLPISLPNYLGAANYMVLFNEALVNDGADPNSPTSGLFDNELINATRSGTNPYEYPDVDYYDFVEPFINTTSLITEFSGGNDKNQYYVNVGWNRNEAWVNVNDEINAGTNRFNVRGNIDFKINDWITSSLDGIAVISTIKSSRANLLNSATTIKPNAYSPFLPVNLVDTSDPVVADQLATARQFNGFILGTSQQFKADAPIALAIAGGYNNTVIRSTQFNNSLNFDLDRITKGLSAKTYLSFDFYDSYSLSINNQFKTYVPEWRDNTIINFGTSDHDNDPTTPNISDDSRIFGENLKAQTESVNSGGFTSRFGFYGLINYQKTIAEKHSLNTTLLAFYNSETRNNVIQKDIDSHLGFQMSYDYKKKLFVDFSGSYIHSIKLPEGNRGGLSPTLGLAYVLSEEPFLEDNSFVNYLKLKASGGIIKTDAGINGYYIYDENYRSGSNFNWSDGQNSNRLQTITQGANPNLTFEERIDLNIGVEAYLMNSLWVEANYFRTELDKRLSTVNNLYPSFYGIFRPRINFDANLYSGVELALNYNKTFNDFTIGIGANVLYNQTEATKRSRVFEFDYQNVVGRELNTLFALVDQGFYKEEDFNIDADGKYTLKAGLAVPSYGDVQPGDIKYQNQNTDLVIDDNDRVDIGQTTSPWTYGVNLNLNYKRFNLFVLGTGQTGAIGNKLTGFNGYYSPNGANAKYSEVVLGRWTPATANTATFPRLSAKNNNNNFQNSTFWTYDNSYFAINRAQLTYEFDDVLCEKLNIQDLNVNVSGTNLFEISENKDIRQLRIGSNPMDRSFTLGVRVSF